MEVPRTLEAFMEPGLHQSQDKDADLPFIGIIRGSVLLRGVDLHLSGLSEDEHLSQQEPKVVAR